LRADTSFLNGSDSRAKGFTPHKDHVHVHIGEPHSAVPPLCDEIALSRRMSFKAARDLCALFLFTGGVEKVTAAVLGRGQGRPALSNTTTCTTSRHLLQLQTMSVGVCHAAISESFALACTLVGPLGCVSVHQSSVLCELNCCRTSRCVGGKNPLHRTCSMQHFASGAVFTP
jgi:hypothetical protein